jgi:serine protease Do
MGMQIREMMNWSRARKRLASLLIVATLGVGILIGTVISGRVGASRAVFEGGVKTLVLPDPVVMSNTFSGIVAKLGPAVVNISTVGQVQQRPQSRRPQVRPMPGPAQPNGPTQPNGPNSQVRPHGNGNGNDDPNSMQDFFDRFFDNPDQGGQEEPDRSLGSGIIVDPKGYILTNNHVVDQASRIQVQLSGEPTLYNAKVIGVDTETDLAVIKIDIPRDLPFAKLGNSDGVQVGDWVLAIGSPFNLSGTVTAGIISAKDRSNIGDERRQFQRFLQTDAAINPGNSGGPLVDMAGQVIGINTAIMTGSRSMGNEGVGFAMPSNMAINVYNQIVTHGHVTRGSIGITFVEADGQNPIVLRSKGAQYGMIVGSVAPGGPAEKSGLKVGDVITTANGKPIHTANQLVDTITQTSVGDKVQLTYLRDKQPHQLSIAVTDYSKTYPDQAEADDSAPSAPAAAEFGMHVEDITPEVAHQLGLNEKQQGVVVARVDPASFGEDIGIGPGEIVVIVEINGQSVSNMADYRKIIATLKPGQDVIFKVLERGDGGLLTRLLAGVVPSPN